MDSGHHPNTENILIINKMYKLRFIQQLVIIALVAAAVYFSTASVIPDTTYRLLAAVAAALVVNIAISGIL